jgi:hypothetical protein
MLETKIPAAGRAAYLLITLVRGFVVLYSIKSAEELDLVGTGTGRGGGGHCGDRCAILPKSP